jgi:hypothetical protein
MADTYSPLIRLALQANLGNVNQWGNIFNAAVYELIDSSVAGEIEIDTTLGNVTLQALNGSPDTSRAMMLRVVGNPGGTTTITVPTLSKIYIVINETDPAQIVQLKTALSPAISIAPSSAPAVVFVDPTSNRVRPIGRANGISPMTAFVNYPVTFANRTAGTVGITVKYAKQGHFVTLVIPQFSVTVSAGFTFNENPPAIILPDNGIDSFTFSPGHLSGMGANAVAAFFINAAAGNKWGFTNVGTAAFGAGPYTQSNDRTYVYSTRS